MTGQSETSAWIWITDPDVASELSRPALLKALGPFLGRELTLSEAGARLGWTVKRLFPLARRLQTLGLLQVSRVTPRPGRAIRHYTATAPGLFLPFDSTNFETLELALERTDALFRPLYFRSLARLALEKGQRWGLRITRSGHSVQVSAGAPPGDDLDLLDAGAPAVLPAAWDLGLMLDFADAKALQRDLEALRRSYSGRGGAQAYLLGLSLTPL